MTRALLIENGNCRKALVNIFEYLKTEIGVKTIGKFTRIFPQLKSIINHTYYSKNNTPTLLTLYQVSTELQIEFHITPYEISVHPYKDVNTQLDRKEIAVQWLNLCIEACNRGLLLIRNSEFYIPAGAYNWSLPLATFNHRSKPHCPIMRTVLACLTVLPDDIYLVINGDGIYLDGIDNYPVIKQPDIKCYWHCPRCKILRPNTEYRVYKDICVHCLREQARRWKHDHPEAVKLTNNKYHNIHSLQKLQLKNKVGKNLLSGIAVNLRKLKDGE